jgi:fatty-acyl-CoA synthase
VGAKLLSLFIEMLQTSANGIGHSETGLVTGEPARAVRNTWWQVHVQSRRMAGGLMSMGLRRGARVAVLACLPVEVAPAIQAVWLAGGSVTMLHQPTARTDLQGWTDQTVGMLRMLGADAVLVDATFAPLMARTPIRCHRIDELDADPVDQPVHTGDEDLAVIQLTNGATAAPKAVAISHGNLMANMTAIIDRAQLEPANDVMMSWLPTFHDMGMIGFLTLPMTLGCELVKISPLDFLADPLVWLSLITKYRATVTSASADAYAMVAKRLATVSDPSAYDLSTVRITMVGAEPTNPDTVRAFVTEAQRFGLAPSSIAAAYGMAEVTVAASFELGRGLQTDVLDGGALLADRRAIRVPEPDQCNTMPRGTCELVRLGRPLPGLSARVVDGRGAVMPEFSVGEIQLRGGSISPRYITADGPTETANADGWWATGDLGYLADGEIVICGRLQDAISYDGRTIFPTDVERAAASVDGVRAHSVVAVRVQRDSAREYFAVVVESDLAGDEDAEKLLALEVTERVIAEVDAKPRAVVVVAPGSVPKTTSGKRRRSAVGSLFANQIVRLAGE